MTDTITPRNNTAHAAQQAVLKLIESSGSDLFKQSGVSPEGGEKAADFLIAFHKKLTDYYKTLA